MMMKIKLNNLQETARLASVLAAYLKPDSYVLLSGDLAAGKTTFTKYLLKALLITEVVGSPTFVIMNQYFIPTGTIVNHMDAYRLLNLDSSDEWTMYLDEFAGAINVIEWPMVIERFIPKNSMIFRLHFATDDSSCATSRVVEIEADGKELENEIFNAFGK